MSEKIVSVSSSKGGIGKSTVSLGIARTVAKLGCPTLLVDLDFGNSCLDMLGGVQDSVLYTLADAVSGICTPEAAVVKMHEEGLYLMPAPVGGNIPLPEGDKICSIVKKAAKSVGASYVIIDTPAGVSESINTIFGISDTVITVASHSPVTVRAAESTAKRIHSAGTEDVKLIINSFDTENILHKSKNQRAGMFQIIDESGIPLLGVIPYDYNLELSGENPNMPYSTDVKRAFENIALRIDGESVPLFCGMKKIRKKKKILFS